MARYSFWAEFYPVCFDMGTILLVFLLADRLFGKFWLSWVSALLYACAVLPIQISHFFIVDNFTTFLCHAGIPGRGSGT